MNLIKAMLLKGEDFKTQQLSKLLVVKTSWKNCFVHLYTRPALYNPQLIPLWRKPVLRGGFVVPRTVCRIYWVMLQSAVTRNWVRGGCRESETAALLLKIHNHEHTQTYTPTHADTYMKLKQAPTNMHTNKCAQTNSHTQVYFMYSKRPITTHQTCPHPSPTDYWPLEED